MIVPIKHYRLTSKAAATEALVAWWGVLGNDCADMELWFHGSMV